MMRAICLISNFNYFTTYILKFCELHFFLGAIFEIAKTINVHHICSFHSKQRLCFFYCLLISKMGIHLLGNHHFTAICKSSWKFYTLFKSISNVAAKVLFQCLLGSKYCTKYLISYIEICYKPNG